MANRDNSYEVGYAKPPRQTRFVKGQSGNPKGRPKGSKNLATMLARACRERVRVTGNNGARSITKLETSLVQLSNQAASGDLRAIREFLYWIRFSEESEQSSVATPISHERDHAVIASILERIRQCEPPASVDGTSSDAECPPPQGE